MMCFLCRNSPRRKIARVAMTHVPDDLHNDNRPSSSRLVRNVYVPTWYTRVFDNHKKDQYYYKRIMCMGDRQKTKLNNIIYVFEKKNYL